MNKDIIPSRDHHGQITRGKTAHNRLRRVNQFILHYDPMLIHRKDLANAETIFVDHGFGWAPFTTLESARLFHAINPTLKIVGVEIAPERVATGEPFLTDKIDFRLGGFDIPYETNQQARLIRSFNVLRQYDEADYLSSVLKLTEGLMDGGLLIEGTSNPNGRWWCANLIRKQKHQLHYLGIVFSTNFRDGFSPSEFQPYLPKNLIHHMHEDHPIANFLQAWQHASQTTIHNREHGYRQWYASCIEEVASMGFAVETRRRFTRRGFCIFRWENTYFEELATT